MTEDDTKSLDNAVRKLALTTAATLLGALVLGTGAWYVESQRIDERTTAQVASVERRLDAIEDRVEGLAELQRSVTTLATRVDAWRQSDVAIRAAERETLEGRLGRIERAVERRR